MKNPFDPNSGPFATNIRSDGDDDDAELMESMKAFGWNSEFPALVDEHGVVLVGNRRMKVAKALGIAVRTKTLTLGSGDEADASRFQLAIISNIGSKPMAKKDRTRIAEYLYGEREWTMQRIAEALGVTHKTISKDLQGFVPEVQTPPRPKGGRPKGSKKRNANRKNDSAAARTAANLVLDEGLSYEKAGAETGLGSDLPVRIAVAREEGRREILDEPQIPPGVLSMSAQEKLATAIRQHQRKLDLEFESRVREEYQKRLNEFLPDFNKKLAEAEEIVKARSGVMSRATFRKILACLHPDRSMSDTTLKDAFQKFEKLELVLCSEKEMPTPTSRFPRTYAEMMELKQKTTAARKAKRNGTRNALTEGSNS